MKALRVFSKVKSRFISGFLVAMIISLSPIHGDCQYKYDYEWLIGYNGQGWNLPDFAINKISFHNFPPDTIRTSIIGTTGNVATLSMANSEGELIFFSNGCSLFDHEGNEISGGEQLVDGLMYNRQCNLQVHQNAYGSWIQSLLALPMDNADSLFFIINHRFEETDDTNFEAPGDLVAFDLQLTRVVQTEGGNYEVEDMEILVDDLVGLEGMVAVRDIQPNYWWLIVPPAHHKNNYRSMRLGPDGLDTTVVYLADYSHFVPGNRIGGGGQSAVSPNGDLFVKWSPEDTLGTFLLDFNRENGELANLRHLPHPESDNFVVGESSSGGGAAISPNGRFLYINTRNNLYQYDLEASDISESIVHIAEYDGYVDDNFGTETTFFIQQLGPDCRIYMSATNAVSYLHTINYPNLKGEACDFQQHSIQLPGSNTFALPYHPNYRLDSGYPACDTTLTHTRFVPEDAKGQLYLYPNPAHQYAVIGWSEISPEEVTLYDISGHKVYSGAIQPGSQEYKLDLSGLATGVYVVQLRDRQGNFAVERLMVME
ncbi:MAG: T9SS C-terminal target domain-containing protein [Saprospirales bacterium]|nr:MAG: T9SS C-terminal target domain-containing protein [Saprospirales bacterium]